MAEKKLTIYQKLGKAITGNWNVNDTLAPHVNHYDLSNRDILYKTTDEDDYKRTKLEYQQDRALKANWYKANTDLTLKGWDSLNAIRMMYRDTAMMDAFPEIGAALDIVSEESTIVNAKGKVVNVYSNSSRVKSLLEDLFANRLNLQIMAQMVIRDMCKDGNEFMILDIDRTQGVKGWRRLPVEEVERHEAGLYNPYSTNVKDKSPNATTFVWTGGRNGGETFRDWQVAHFRLLHNSTYLPYGCSYLNSARRHWRMLSLMEDMMLIYRLDRSIERRVYKIFVGSIDDQDVQAYVQEIANNFKRTPIIDPNTGQLDLRKNILGVDQDLFIPVRDQSAPTPIDTLAAAQNLTAMDDIKYVQNKVCTALRIPRSFLNFEDAAGDGKNLSLMDVRFSRTVNRIQQAFLMELTKIACIHLYLLKFYDDLTNFSLTMNNPSTQAETLEVENMSKKIGLIRDAVADPGNGIPILSTKNALKMTFNWSDQEIKENLEEIRLEKAISVELEKTDQIIKNTRVFDTVDRIYGEPGATYADGDEQNGGGPDGAGGPPMGGGGMDFGGGLDDMGDMGVPPEEGNVAGEEGTMPTGDMDNAPEGGAAPPIPNEAAVRNGNLITENVLQNIVNKKARKENGFAYETIYNKSLMINEDIDKMIKHLDDFVLETDNNADKKTDENG